MYAISPIINNFSKFVLTTSHFWKETLRKTQVNNFSRLDTEARSEILFLMGLSDKGHLYLKLIFSTKQDKNRQKQTRWLVTRGLGGWVEKMKESIYSQ